jgi:hypothetical protein
MSRSHQTDLLTRPPCGVDAHDDSWMAYVLDPTAQLASLAELLAQGYISGDEFDRQKSKIIGR